MAGAEEHGFDTVELNNTDSPVYEQLTQALLESISEEYIDSGASVVALYSGFEVGTIDSLSVIRLDEHLGAFAIEAKKIHAHEVMSKPLELSALASVAALTASALPEREHNPGLYESLLILLENLDDRAIWPAVLVKWELGSLADAEVSAVKNRLKDLAISVRALSAASSCVGPAPIPVI